MEETRASGGGALSVDNAPELVSVMPIAALEKEMEVALNGMDGKDG
jgi:hypothetical protein